jgi:uncharacterized small protein (DUF1192 family)
MLYNIVMGEKVGSGFRFSHQEHHGECEEGAERYSSLTRTVWYERHKGRGHGEKMLTQSRMEEIEKTISILQNELALLKAHSAEIERGEGVTSPL